MKISENARIVLTKRYLAKDENGTVTETVEGLFERVANAVAAADATYAKKADVAATAQTFYDMMTNLDFLPNSPTLMNAGRPLGQLSACFVLPVEDSMEAIFESIKNAALIHKSGGGTGFSFSRLRPSGSTVKTTGGVASGPISFMKVFNVATEAVKQGGTRRGANMGILRVDHPDILQFIDCKQNNADITNFNISVGITEEFMKAVESGSDYDLIEPHSGKTVGSLNAKELFAKIVEAAWRNGEPGIIFLDRLNAGNTVPAIGEIESTNPCGEQPLLPYESCNLGSINLVNFVTEDKNGKKYIDEQRLRTVVADAVHFLDNVIDVNNYPLEMIGEQTRLTRKIGLGVMGFADMLLLLGVPYNSEEGIAIADGVMSLIDTAAKGASEKLAEERGCFPAYEQSIYNGNRKMRNATVTTIAPTGTLSIIAECSGGIEPVFAYVFIRNVMDKTQLIEVNPVLKAVLQERGLYSEELMRKIAENGCLGDIEEIPDDIKKVFVSSHEVSPAYHIRMQATFQKHVDNAVSKTVNFCNSATKEDVAEVYLLAYKLGCKGVTIYRDGSRTEQVLNIGKVNKEGEEESAVLPSCSECTLKNRVEPRPRPDITTGFTEKVSIGCGNLYVTVNYDDNGICEVFTNTGRHGGCPSQSEATARLLSIALRSGIDTDELINQLKGIRCPSTIRRPGCKVTSCPDAIARVINKVYNYKNGFASESLSSKIDAETEKPAVTEGSNMRFCPECGAKIEHEGGCVICKNCGYSKCG